MICLLSSELREPHAEDFWSCKKESKPRLHLKFYCSVYLKGSFSSNPWYSWRAGGKKLLSTPLIYSTGIHVVKYLEIVMKAWNARLQQASCSSQKWCRCIFLQETQSYVTDNWYSWTRVFYAVAAKCFNVGDSTVASLEAEDWLVVRGLFSTVGWRVPLNGPFGSRCSARGTLVGDMQVPIWKTRSLETGGSWRRVRLKEGLVQ